MRWLVLALTGALVLGAGACNAIFGVDDLRYDAGIGGGIATGGSGPTGGAMAAGGQGVCTEGDERPCYDGPDGTEDVGACRGGVERCEDGGWSICQDQVLPSLEVCATDADDDCDGTICGELVWATTFGDGGYQYVHDLIAAPDGSVRMVGSYDGLLALDPSQGTADNANGFWASFDGEGAVSDVGVALGQTVTSTAAVVPGGDLVVGGAHLGNLIIGGQTLFGADGPFDGHVARLTSAGELVWAKRIGAGGSDSVISLDHRPSSGLFVGGFYASGTLQVDGMTLMGAGGATLSDAFVIRMDDDGTPLWGRAFGDGGTDSAPGVAAHPDGGVTLALELSSDAGLNVPNQGGTDAGVAHLDNAGNVVWARSFGGNGDDRSEAVTHHPDGLTIVGGSFEGVVDFDGSPINADGRDGFVVALDESAMGAVSWVFPVSGANQDQVTSVATDPQGRVYASGFYEGPLTIAGRALPPPNGRSPFVIRFFADGTVDYAFGWSANAGPVPLVGTYGRSLVVALDDGSAVVSGSFTDAIDFGRGPVAAVDDTDGFILRLAP